MTAEVAPSAEAQLPALRRLVGDELPAIRSVAFQRLETALAQLSTIAANESRLANTLNARLAWLVEAAAHAEGDGDEKRVDKLMRRIVVIGNARGKHYDRIVATTERVLVVAEHLGIDIGAAGTLRPAEASVKGEPEDAEKAPEFRFKRSESK